MAGIESTAETLHSDHDLVAASQQDGNTPERYAVVIPAYNEGPTIREIVQGALNHVKDVLVVDDGSTDATSEALNGLPVTLLRNPSNMGKAASLWRGFEVARKAGANALVTLDGDGQHSPNDIPRLLAAAKEFPDYIIIGARHRRWRHGPFWRLMANGVADFWVSWAAGYSIADTQSGYRVYPSRLLQKAKVKHGRAQSFVFESEILIEGARLKYHSIPVPIESASREVLRPSYFRPVLDILRITRMVAWKLISRGMYPTGLYRSLLRRGVAAGFKTGHTCQAPSSSHPEKC